jgi:hypothetical protein
VQRHDDRDSPGQARGDGSVQAVAEEVGVEELYSVASQRGGEPSDPKRIELGQVSPQNSH